jgi:predicted NACHT family NTPase
MAKRSLKISDHGIARAKQAFERKGWTQEYLAAEVGLSTRQSVWKFFAGKPIDRHIFMEICFILDLDWQEVSGILETPHLSKPVGNFEHSQAQELIAFKEQYNDLIENQCGFLESSFETSWPQSLDKFYTKTYLLPHLSGQQWLDIPELEAYSSHTPQQRRNLNPLQTQIMPAVDLVEKESKLFILGKPGSGKTTFLQYLALQCQRSQLLPDLVPVFLRLHLLKLEEHAVNQFDLVSLLYRKLNNQEYLNRLLEQGKLLILLDGLDEVSDILRNELLSNISIFTESYNKNKIIITSRIAAQNYYLRGFNYVEISEFSQSQVKDFVEKWFIDKNKNDGKLLAERFLKALDLKENQAIQELTVTPIFLNFLCFIYYNRGSFPSNRYKLYQIGLDILLVSWDKSKGVEREQVYQQFSLANKIKLLSYLAEEHFQKGKYFFEKVEILQMISSYLPEISEVSFSNKDKEDLWSISENILASIQLQHGLLVERAKDIYSFSHLTFQEYLTARKIVNMATGNQQEKHLEQVATHLTNPAWREVILMINSLLPDAYGLLKQLRNKIDFLIANKATIKTFLEFLETKAQTIPGDYKRAAVKAFYFSLLHDRNLNLAIAIDVNLAGHLSPPLALDLALARMLSICEQIVTEFSLKTMLEITLAFDLERKYPLAEDFKVELIAVKEKLPSPSLGKESLESWWKTEGISWCRSLQQTINKHCYLGQDWQFNDGEREVLTRYYQANQFLVECLDSPCTISPELRQEIERSLLS